MGRRHVDVSVPALALRRAEAAAALDLSPEVFDEHVRHAVPSVVLSERVTVYPVAGLAAWLDRNAAIVADDLERRRRRAS